MQLRKYIVSFLICGGIFGLSGCDGLFRDAPYNKLSQETIWGIYSIFFDLWRNIRTFRM